MEGPSLSQICSGPLKIHTRKVKAPDWISIPEHQQCYWMENTNDLVQDCSNSIASALELLQSCTKLSTYDLTFLKHTTITMVYHHHGIFGPKKVKGPHPGSELCSADFAFVPSLVIGPFTVHIRLDIHFNSLGGVFSRSPATWCHGLQICPHRYPFPPGSREAMQHEMSCSGAQWAVTAAGYWTRDLT